MQQWRPCLRYLREAAEVVLARRISEPSEPAAGQGLRYVSLGHNGRRKRSVLGSQVLSAVPWYGSASERLEQIHGLRTKANKVRQDGSLNERTMKRSEKNRRPRTTNVTAKSVHDSSRRIESR